ncbi:uncharacterized protein involved in type VI secretion and phage assembly [Paraburkholderia bannensis]|uniref:Uncharacterized protein involved in type VI secretion and phage assembly n=1 Tax=Paraburkholderia bannensis TaxID=765414 RepID=A0A7W9WSP7_9BURK|nr:MULTISPECIES: contractile injection system protein, VgrG/Pvc8 family [Paraburkholderia]MBB3257524.1 uncharacterized protein involved in type VI secretion and phage assembly [Paraburkholderia sp. WP4_3_2]MBB6102537.1 uncharacterized protein involved in type VI secretion and phage assembly [Paraburkholderia bannensis]
MNSRDPLVVRPGIDVHQYYSLDIPSSPSAAQADIYAFTGTRGMGVPTKYVIQFTHPQRDLPRSDFIMKTAAFVIQPPRANTWDPPEDARKVYGVITGFAQLAGNHDQTMYEVTLESRLALLRNMPRQRFFFDKSEPEIIQQILGEHKFNQVFADFDNRTHDGGSKKRGRAQGFGTLPLRRTRPARDGADRGQHRPAAP